MNWFLQIYDLNNLLLCNSSHISGFCKAVQQSNLLPTSIHVWRRISCIYGKTCHHRAQRCQFNTLTQRQRTFIKEGYFFLENIKERGIVAVKHSLTTRTVPWMLFQEGPQKHCPYNQPGAGHMLPWSYQGQLATWLEIRTRCGIERYHPFICPFKMHFFLSSFMRYNWQLKNIYIFGHPWWYTGWESTCQCRGHGRFDPWSGKIPRAAEQLSLLAATTEPRWCSDWSLCA